MYAPHLLLPAFTPPPPELMVHDFCRADVNSSTAKLYERLQESDGSETVAEIVLLALGAFERYYACWKTESGEYRQGN